MFAFGDQRRNPLLDALPLVLLMRREMDDNNAQVVKAITALLDSELLSNTPGAEIISTRLADILFIQVIRHHLRAADALPQGWLRSMTDASIAPALAPMQRAPAKAWSVEGLAREIGMSCSVA